MRWRQVGFLYVVLAILAVFYVWERPATPVREGERPPRPRFLTVTANDVAAIRLVRGGRTVSLRRDGRDWVVVEPAGMQLPSDLVTGFLQALLTTEEIDHVATTTGELGSFGLDEQADRVELAPASGDAVIVTLGSTNPTGTALYARRGPDGGVVLIGRQVRDYEDMIYNALPRGAVPADTADGRIGLRTPLLFNASAV
jgi:hypothetical protein